MGLFNTHLIAKILPELHDNLAILLDPGISAIIKPQTQRQQKKQQDKQQLA